MGDPLDDFLESLEDNPEEKEVMVQEPETSIMDAIEDLEEEKTEVTVSTGNSLANIDASDNEEIANLLVGMVMDDRGKADQAYDLFYTGLVAGKDHSQASKEALLRSIEAKNMSAKNLIDLLKIKSGGQTGGISVNVLSAKKTGISLDNVKKHV